MAIPKPLIMDNAGLELGTTAEPPVYAQLACVANHIELAPDTSVTTLDTMCGSADYPGITKWSLVATLYQSFDPAATEEILSAAVEGGEAVPFRVVGYRDAPVSATNPMWTGEVVPQPYAPINGDAGEASIVELEWGVIGAPEKIVVPPTALLAAQGYEAMTVVELQAEASSRGLPTTGTKAELIERLSGA